MIVLPDDYLMQQESIKRRRTIKKSLSDFTLSILNGVYALIFPEYCKCMRRHDKPTLRVFVPRINEVNRLLSDTYGLTNAIQKKLIPYLQDRTHDHPLGDSMGDFLTNDLDGQISDVIIPYIRMNIPHTIIEALHLNQRSSFYEDKSIDMFDRKELTDEMCEFVFEEVYLNLMVYSNAFIKNTETDCTSPQVSHVICIQNNICAAPLYISSKIFEMPNMMETISFTTSTTFDGTRITSRYDTNTISYWRLKTE